MSAASGILGRRRKGSKKVIEEDPEAEEDAELEAELKALRAIKREENGGVDDEDDENSNDEEQDEEEEDSDDMNVEGSAGSSSSKKNNKGIYHSEMLEQAVQNLGELPFLETQQVSKFRLEFTEENDDLEREVAFYNHSVSAVEEGYKLLKQHKVPTLRPVDYFAEHVKSDQHMAKIKDRLILEEKKIEALEARKLRDLNRKYNKRQTVSKKKSNGDVDDGDEIKGRRGRGRNKDEANGERQGSSSLREGGPSRKKMIMDKKYGFGGKERRKSKLNDAKSLNDMSTYNPKAGKGGRSFGVRGGERSGSAGKGRAKKAGGNRPGKASRDKQRSNRSKSR